MIRIALLLFALCAIPAVAGAQAEAPDADEYAVWSAVLDSMMPGSEHVRLLDTTIVMASLLRGSVLAMDGSRHPRLDSVAVDDFLRRNRVGARLEARFPARRPVVLVRGPRATTGTGRPTARTWSSSRGPASTRGGAGPLS